MDFATVLGLAAACGTTVSFIPQAFETIRTREVSGISLSMYTIFTLGTLLWLIYGLLTGTLPVTIANAITLVFASIILVYKIKYRKK